jgi:transcriptional regulator with XRE-family HTH domain
MTGIPKTNLSDLENGKRIPMAQEIKKIAKALGVDPELLWEGSDK